MAHGFLNVEPKCAIFAEVKMATTFGWHFVSFLTRLHIHLLVATEFVLHGPQNTHILFDLAAPAILSIEAFAPFGIIDAITVLLGIHLLAIASVPLVNMMGELGSLKTVAESTVSFHLARDGQQQDDREVQLQHDSAVSASQTSEGCDEVLVLSYKKKAASSFECHPTPTESNADLWNWCLARAPATQNS